MALIVQKFGGTSVSSVNKIRAVAQRVADARDAGHKVIVVLSAMAGDTDRLQDLGSAISAKPAPEEMDVLLASGEGAVLPTIASRCQLLRLRPVPWPDLSEELVARFGLGADGALELARTCGGRPGLAIRMATDEEFRTGIEEALDRIEAAAAADLEGRLGYAARLARLFARDREGARREMVQWTGWWRDVLLASQGLDEFVGHVSRAASIGAAAGALGPAGAAAGLGASLRASERLDMNVSPPLAIEQMMLSMPAGGWA